MAQDLPEAPGDTGWFVHDRFGMFIHWGIYAAAARHEWVKKYEEITDEEYQKYFDHFNPDLYDPKEWARLAADAGMKYFAITTKHHDGFCLWDSQLTDYKATNAPCGQDLIAPMVDAFRSEGLKVGFYHSLIDWHHPEFPIDAVHPQCNDEEFLKANQGRDITKYAEYLHGQVRELLTNYGKIDLLFFDFSYSGQKGEGLLADGKGKDDWQAEKLIEMVRDLQPGIVVNDRTEIPQDYVTPEQVQPEGPVMVDGKPMLWEACQTFSGSWGYYRDEFTWKSSEMVARMLIDGVSKGGNMIMNVGPTARGEIEPRAVERLEAIGEWMRLHNRSIYGCGSSDFAAPPDCRYTQNGDRLYLHLFAWPFKHVRLKGLAGKVEYAQLLNDASEIQFTEGGQVSHRLSEEVADTVVLELPVNKPPVAVPVIELFLK